MDETLESLVTSTEGDESLPEYDDSGAPHNRSHRRPYTLTEHVYSLKTDKTRPWAFLKVNSRTKSTKHIPLFVEGDVITGSVELVTDKAEHIQAVILDVWGESWLGQTWSGDLQGSIPFWSHNETLWSASMRDIGNEGSNLNGKQVLPFSVTIPSKFNRSIKDGQPDEFTLPPRFLEKRSPLHVDYRINVTFARGRFRKDLSLSTSFSYIPRSRPGAPSIMRQLSYREKWCPMGPHADPEGWKVFGPLSVMGNLFGARLVEVGCTFALAKPLCYARNTFIPFAITIACGDNLALDLFGTSGSISVRLMRTIHLKADISRFSRAETSATNCVASGVYWRSQEDAQSPETRKFRGEIPIKADTRPSFEFPPLLVEYHVSLDLTTTGFDVRKTDADAPLFKREVIIASDPAPGPTARSCLSHKRRHIDP